MCKLTGWYLGYQFFGESRKVVAKGIVYDHPKLRDGADIHTSAIVSIHIENDVAKIRTRNNLYECSMKDARYEKFVDITPYKFALEEVIEAIEAGREKYGCKEVKPADGQVIIVLGENRPYYYDSVHIKYKGKERHQTEKDVHVGMFQDSVLSRFTFGDEYIFFDYFPYKGRHVEFYNWDDCGLDVYIENCGNEDMYITVAGNVYRVEPGQRKLIDETNMELTSPSLSTEDLYNAW